MLRRVFRSIFAERPCAGERGGLEIRWLARCRLVVRGLGVTEDAPHLPVAFTALPSEVFETTLAVEFA
jgi:hypothetical protein